MTSVGPGGRLAAPRTVAPRLAVGGLVVGGLVVGGLVASLSAAVYLAAFPPIWFGDADWYAAAMPALAGDAPLYPPSWLRDHVAARPPRFNLPPAVALLAPLAALGRPVWGLLMGGCVVAALAILWPRHYGRGGLYLACALAAFWPLWAALAWANLNSLVFLLLAVACRWPRQAGWAIGLAASLKAAPILALSVLIGRREWRQLVIALGTGASATFLAAFLVGPEALWQFVLVQLHETHPPIPVGWSAAEVATPVLAWLLAVALAGVAVWRGGSWGWAVAACLVAVPTLHLHYWIWALVPLLGRLRGDGVGRETPRASAVVGPRSRASPRSPLERP